MVCPYCQQEMRKGVIHRDRYHLKWVADEDDKGPVLDFFSKGIKLTELGKDYVEAFCCEECRKVIIDLATEN